MIAQVLAHAGQIDQGVHAQGRQMLGRPEARELQELGRVGGARANQDFPRRLHALKDAAAHDPDTLGPPALEFNRHHLRPGTHF